jgi:hypothetical protein
LKDFFHRGRGGGTDRSLCASARRAWPAWLIAGLRGIAMVDHRCPCTVTVSVDHQDTRKTVHFSEKAVAQINPTSAMKKSSTRLRLMF